VAADGEEISLESGQAWVVSWHPPPIVGLTSTTPPFARAPSAPDSYPVALRSEMDEVMELVYAGVHNGVYRAGFAGSQRAYDAAYRRRFARLRP
jgi:glutathionyl-hydroquinone reductase